MKSGVLAVTVALTMSACASTGSNAKAEGETARIAAAEPAPAPTAATAAEPAAETVASGGDTVICKTSVVTGTRVGKQRSCRTKDEWARLEEDARNTGEAIQRQGSMEGSQEIVPGGN